MNKQLNEYERKEVKKMKTINKRRGISLLLAVIMTMAILSSFFTMAANAVPFSSATEKALFNTIENLITNPSAVDGFRYVDNSTDARAWTRIFSGLDIPLYYSKNNPIKSGDLALGKKPVPPGYTRYIYNSNGSQIWSGQSCVIYAYAVFYGMNGRLPNYASTTNSNFFSNKKGTIKKVSVSDYYSLFYGKGVTTGTCICTENTSGRGHALIVLYYNKYGIAFLDANGSFDGKVVIREYQWARFHSFVSYDNRGLYYFVNPNKPATWKYNATAALNYAKGHYNDGKGLNGEFVSDCIKAGGCSCWSTSCSTLVNQLKSSGRGVMNTVTLDNNMSLKASSYSAKMTPGDVVFFYCPKCNGIDGKPYVNAVIYKDTDSSGYMRAYSRPLDGRVINGTSRYCYRTACCYCGGAISKTAYVFHFYR